MAKERMERRAADNTYLHRDFHGALSCAIQYIDDRYGPDAVRDYLRRFTRSFYAPLIARIAVEGLTALREHIESVYDLEGGIYDIEYRPDYMLLTVRECPAVTHMRSNGYPVARLFMETTRTVNDALCEGTPFEADLLDYDETTGRSVQRFRRRRTPGENAPPSRDGRREGTGAYGRTAEGTP